MSEILHSTLNKIAERLGVKRKTALRWIKKRGLPAFQEREYGPWMVTEASLSGWLTIFEETHQNPAQKNRVNR